MDPTQLTMYPTRLTKQIEYAQKEKEIMNLDIIENVFNITKIRI